MSLIDLMDKFDHYASEFSRILIGNGSKTIHCTMVGFKDNDFRELVFSVSDLTGRPKWLFWAEVVNEGSLSFRFGYTLLEVRSESEFVSLVNMALEKYLGQKINPFTSL